MSHFTVLVIGNDIEEQLAPYDENMKVPTYQTQVSPEELARMCEHYKIDATDDDAIIKNSVDWCGKKMNKRRNSVWEYPCTYNPQSKWDWYSVGGRWIGFFKLKPGAKGELGDPGLLVEEVTDTTRADVAKKGDIDIEAMRVLAGEKAAKDYDEFHAKVNGREWPVWEDIVAKHKDGDGIEKARDEYWNHPVIVDIKEWAFGDIRVYRKTRDEFIKASMDNALVTYALVKDGKWYERGKMGWWGISFDEKDNDVWVREFNSLINSVPDDTLLTLVDCHI